MAFVLLAAIFLTSTWYIPQYPRRRPHRFRFNSSRLGGSSVVKRTREREHCFTAGISTALKVTASIRLTFRPV